MSNPAFSQVKWEGEMRRPLFKNVYMFWNGCC